MDIGILTPMERGHYYMDMFEESNINTNHLKYFINIAKYSDELSIGISGSAKEMKAHFDKVQLEIDTFYKRAHHLTFDDYPELWI